VVRRTGRRRPRLDPFAIVAACAACAAQVIDMTVAHEYEPGHYSAPIHLAHVAEVEARGGWRLHHDLYGQRGRTDLVCQHIRPA
jgi:hypothetical protein